MRNFILAMIVAQNVRESRAMVIPEGALIHMVGEKTFTDYREALGGVTPSNISLIEDKLRKLGIDGRG
jgi:CRISPR/Cas system-associated exonuclease Cas4 (RecB family)